MFAKRHRQVGLWAVPLALGLMIGLALLAAWVASSRPTAARSAEGEALSEARGTGVIATPASYSLPSGSATPDPTPCDGNYTYTVSSGVIVPGTNLVPGSQCAICVVGIA